MIAVVMPFKFTYSFIPTQFQLPGKFVDVVTHIRKQFLLSNAAYIGIRLVHTDVLNIVEFTEYA